MSESTAERQRNPFDEDSLASGSAWKSSISSSFNENSFNKSDRVQRSSKASSSVAPAVSLPLPAYDPAVNYEELFWDLFKQNEKTMKKIRAETKDMKMLQREAGEQEARNKRPVQRRRQSVLRKQFRCAFPGCAKSYGCQSALNLHVKNKHTNVSRKVMQKTAHLVAVLLK